MKILLVPSAVSPPQEAPGQSTTSFLVNDSVAIDAGSIGFFRTPAGQASIRHLFLSHSHIDHLASLPILIDNVFEGTADCVTIHASESVLECLRRDIFNNRVWPDFITLSQPNSAFMKLERLEPGRAVEVEGLRITPVSVDHTVPTFGFLVDDGQVAVAFSSDTGPTEALWEQANALGHLRAVFLEATFPDNLAGLARDSKHLTPVLFAAEARKLKKPVSLFAVHIKPRFYAEVVAELRALNLPDLTITEPGVTYSF